MPKKPSRYISNTVGRTIRRPAQRAANEEIPVSKDSISPEMLSKAEKYLKEKWRYDGSEGAELGSWVRNASVSFARATREQQVEGISFAYALFLKVQMDPDGDRILNSAALALGRTRGGRTDDLNILIESVLPYGQTPKEKVNAQKLYSRDARAIRYLIESGIAPDQVVELAKKPKEGLDNWAREYGKSNKKKRQTAKTSAGQKSTNEADVTQGPRIIVHYRTEGDNDPGVNKTYELPIEALASLKSALELVVTRYSLGK